MVNVFDGTYVGRGAGRTDALYRKREAVPTWRLSTIIVFLRVTITATLVRAKKHELTHLLHFLDRTLPALKMTRGRINSFRFTRKEKQISAFYRQNTPSGSSQDNHASLRTRKSQGQGRRGRHNVGSQSHFRSARRQIQFQNINAHFATSINVWFRFLSFPFVLFSHF